MALACALESWAQVPAHFPINEYFIPGFSDSRGRVPVDEALKPAERTALIFVPGQSNATNVTPTAYVPKVRNASN
jgi:hypothetical protein